MYYYQLGNKIACSFHAYDGLETAGTGKASRVSLFLFDRNPAYSRSSFLVNHPSLLYQTEEGAFWLSEGELAKRSGDYRDAVQFAADQHVLAAVEAGRLRAVNTAYPDFEALAEENLPLKRGGGKKTVHMLAVGDVGSNVLTGLHLLGGDCISKIGIYDVAEKNVARWEFEINQITPPWSYHEMPEVYPVSREKLFDCDVFLFTASAGIPPVDSGIRDVRMYQFEKNAKIIAEYARQARADHFNGLFCVISDPVDPLAKAAFTASNTDEHGFYDGLGLLPEQIQSYGLGVMNARAAYYAKRDARFAHFLTEGRAFGPHGQELVIADSVTDYNDTLSRELTHLVVTANLHMRELGFKPYVAPAYSSAALNILRTIRGEWHYGGVFFGGIYMGVKNRYTSNGQEHEILPLPDTLFRRIADAEETLRLVN
ncbi:MAG: lactate dehydrogenase [Lachnospiraceae bacterium]|nr:lactate dehydrogenase [Lachnospiraceae bacterium]